MVITKEKSIVTTQKIMIKESKHTATKSYQIRKEDSERGGEEERIYKIVRKQQNNNSKS